MDSKVSHLRMRGGMAGVPTIPGANPGASEKLRPLYLKRRLQLLQGQIMMADGEDEHPDGGGK